MIAESESHKIVDSKTMWNINVESLSSSQLYNTPRVINCHTITW